MLAIPGDSDNTAVVLVPAEPADSATSVNLLRTAGDSSAIARVMPSDTQVCGDAPGAQLSARGPSGWTVAFSPVVATVRLDSIENATPADSSAFAAEVSRLASAVESDRESRFTGLPFAVLAAHRATIGGKSLVIARVARRIPQEATPLEERTLLIGERAGSSPYDLKYSLRSTGAEDTVEHYLLLAVVRASDKHFVVIESERETGSRYEVLERSSEGSWKLRWSRTLIC